MTDTSETCGDRLTSMVGVRVCTLPARHEGWHHDRRRGTSWKNGDPEDPRYNTRGY